MPYRVLNLAETARYLNLPLDEIQELVKHKEIPFEQRGAQCVFRKNELDCWASQHILKMPGKRLRDYHHAGPAADPADARTPIMPALIREEFIIPELRGKTKASVLREMVALTERTERLGCEPRELLESILERERICSTALEGGIALLHPRHHEPYMFMESFIAVGRAVQAIPFGAADGLPTDLFFLICCQDDRAYLHVLARICLLCLNTPLLQRMRQAADAGGILAAVRQSEAEALRAL
jgi:PTS system nitrogen regulatory IIA component